VVLVVGTILVTKMLVDVKSADSRSSAAEEGGSGDTICINNKIYEGSCLLAGGVRGYKERRCINWGRSYTSWSSCKRR
jgi:hypothetical protein